jgi:hypothetical protein
MQPRHARVADRLGPPRPPLGSAFSSARLSRLEKDALDEDKTLPSVAPDAGSTHTIRLCFSTT